MVSGATVVTGVDGVVAGLVWGVVSGVFSVSATSNKQEM